MVSMLFKICINETISVQTIFFRLKYIFLKIIQSKKPISRYFSIFNAHITDISLNVG